MELQEDGKGVVKEVDGRGELLLMLVIGEGESVLEGVHVSGEGLHTEFWGRGSGERLLSRGVELSREGVPECNPRWSSMGGEVLEGA